MKSKLLTVLTCSALLMGLAACGSNGVVPQGHQLKQNKRPKTKKMS